MTTEKDHEIFGMKVVEVDTLPPDFWMLVSYPDDICGDIEVIGSSG